jgi:hypothetical protein
MVERAESIFSEIKQIKAQYMKEVGVGRRAWPRAIKERVSELESLGLTAKVISAGTGVSYDTIVLWRYKRRKEQRAFHEVRVGENAACGSGRSLVPVISKSVTVTVPKIKMPKHEKTNRQALPPVLSLRTPAGFIVEGLDEKTLIALLLRLNKGAHHAP